MCNFPSWKPDPPALGYQYQLLVSSIKVPAFPPHTVFDREEIHEEIDKEQLRLFGNFALNAAKLAVDAYTMGATSLVKIQEVPKIEGDIEVKNSKAKAQAVG